MELHSLDPGDDHLSDPHTPGHLKSLGAEIHQCNHQLATVIAVDRSRSIRQRDPVLQCQARPGPQLAFISVGDRDAEAGPKEPSFERPELAVFGAGQIVPR
jgi:hypothetical protein